MAVYKETQLRTSYAIIVIALVFILMYPCWLIGDRELYWQEGLYAVEATGIKFWLPLATAHGIVLPNSFPLFPWLAGLIHELTGLPITFILRAIVVAALASVTTLIWHTTRKAANTEAATVAAAVMLSTSIIFEKSLNGYPEMLGILFLTLAWLLWFSIGMMKNNWSLAWSAGYFFCGLAFYTIGVKAIIIFTVPLIFMRRPLTIWPKLRKPGFVVGLAVLTGFIIMWLLPCLQTTSTVALLELPTSSWSDYLIHLLTFPFVVILRFLPWSIITWAPFCVAFIPLDKTPVFSRFLRTIAYSLFFFFWINPSTDSRNLIFLAPPVAILSGLYYWIVIRRYGKQLQLLLKYFSLVAFAIGIAIFAVYLLPETWWDKLFSMHHGMSFTTNSKYLFLSMFYGCMVCGISIWLYTKAGKTRIWEIILLLSLCTATFFWAIMFPYRAQNREKRALGQEISEALKNSGAAANTLIYKSKIVDLYGECYYSGHRVQRITSMTDLPQKQPVIYLLSMGFPSMPTRRWNNLFPAHKMYHNKRLCLWEGELIKKTR